LENNVSIYARQVREAHIRSPEYIAGEWEKGMRNVTRKALSAARQ